MGLEICYAPKRVVCQDVQRVAILACEYELQRPRGNVDATDLGTVAFVDEDLPIRHVNTSVRPNGDTLAASVREDRELPDGAVLIHEAGVRNILGIVREIHALAGRRRDETVSVERIGEPQSAVIAALCKNGMHRQNQ